MQLHRWQRESIDLFLEKKEMIVNVATGCLSGDTCIDLPRDLDKYPLGIPIKELVGKKDFYVYTMNVATGKIELKKCRDVWLTKKNAEVYEVITESGRRILATEEHPFLIDERESNSNNTKTISRRYVQLKDLTIGKYLTVFNRSNWKSKKNYNLLKIDYFNYSRDRKTWGRMEEHKLIMAQLGIKVPDKFIIHHKDHNKNNNSINNLEVMDAKEHSRQHTKERGFYGREVWEKRSREGYKNVDEEELKKKCGRNSQIKYFDKITSIKHYGKTDVYDMEVEDNHNFIANGIFIHNCGKSIMAIKVIEKIREEHPDYNILIVAPKIVILETVWLKELTKFGFGPNQVGVYYGYAHEFSKITLTTIASIPRLDMRIFDVIIADEIHNMMSPSLIKLLKHDFKYKLGLSASIKHIDQRHWKLLAYFHYNIYEYGMREAIKEGIINKFFFHMVGIKITDQDVRDKYDQVDAELKQLLQSYGGFERIMRLPKTNPGKTKVLSLFTQRNDLVNNYAKKINIVSKIIVDNIDKKVLLFSQYNKITRGIYWSLKEVVPRTEIIDTHVREVKRQQFLKEFEEGQYNILLSSRIFEEGYNLPKIDCAIFLSSNSTSRQMIQRLGRILRKKDKPSDAYYIYCIDTFEEDYAMRAKEFVSDVAEDVVIEEY